MTKTRIFILDDDRFYGALIRRSLARDDFEIFCFHSELECIEALAEPPHIIILDHKLEKTTGFEIMELINSSIRPRPVIIYLSAQEYVHVALKALHMGAVTYLEKNEFVLPELKNEIRAIAGETKNFLQPLDRRKYQLQRLKS